MNPLRSDSQRNRFSSFRGRMPGVFSTQLAGHSSRTITRTLPVAGSAATSSITFWRRLVRWKISSLPSGAPLDAVEVVADARVGVLERLTVAGVDLGDRLRFHVIEEDIHDRVGCADLDVGLDVEDVLDGGLLQGEVVVLDLLLVEAVEGDLRRVGRPPHGGVLEQFLAVGPARRAVLDAVLLVAVGGDGDLVLAARRRRSTGCGRDKTPSACRRARWPTCIACRARRTRRRRAAGCPPPSRGLGRGESGAGLLGSGSLSFFSAKS